MIWKKWSRAGYEIFLVERVRGGGEQGVDQIGVAQIQNALLEYNNPNEPQCLVVMTGDGNNSDPRHASFRTAIERALERPHWSVEIWCWKRSCNAVYKALEAKHANTGRFKLYFLDVYRDKIVMNTPHRNSYPSGQATSGGGDGDDDDEDDDWKTCPINCEYINEACRATRGGHFFEKEALVQWLDIQVGIYIWPRIALDTHPHGAI